MLKLEHGEHGLVYATNTDDPALFVAAPTHDEALRLMDQARQAVLHGSPIELHTLCDQEGGGRMTVPNPEWQTRSQRMETIRRMQRHLERIEH